MLTPSEFRDANHTCDWIFDLFAHGYDFLDGRYAPEELESVAVEYEVQWRRVEEFDLIEQIAKADGRIPDSVVAYLDVPATDKDCLTIEFEIRLYCCLRAIDRAAEGINYLGSHTSASPTRWFTVYQGLFVTEGELVRRAPGSVALKPKPLIPPTGPSWWKKAVANGEWEHFIDRGVHFHRHFANLSRSYEVHGCEIKRKILSPSDDVGKLNWDYLKIGVVPLIETLVKDGSSVRLQPGPLRIVQEPSISPRFTIMIEDAGDPGHCCEELCSHAEVALREFSKRKVQIVIFPEMVVPDPVLIHIKKVLAELSAEGNKYPGLVLAGSFTRPVLPNLDNKPYNEAVLLNGNGAELCLQRKMHPYDMHSYESDRFGITELFPGKFSREDIAFNPRQILVVDSLAARMRIAILICEDSAHESPGLHTIRQLRANMIFIPVMAGALLSDRGFGKTVQQLTVDPGGIVVVGNSAALAREQWLNLSAADKVVPQPPLGIVGLPLANLSSNRLPLELLFETSRIGTPDGPEVLSFQSPRALPKTS